MLTVDGRRSRDTPAASGVPEACDHPFNGQRFSPSRTPSPRIEFEGKLSAVNPLHAVPLAKAPVAGRPPAAHPVSNESHRRPAGELIAGKSGFPAATRTCARGRAASPKAQVSGVLLVLRISQVAVRPRESCDPSPDSLSLYRA